MNYIAIKDCYDVGMIYGIVATETDAYEDIKQLIHKVKSENDEYDTEDLKLALRENGYAFYDTNVYELYF